MKKISRLLLKNVTAVLLCAALFSGCAAPRGADGTTAAPIGADSTTATDGTTVNPKGADSTAAPLKVEDTVLASTPGDSREALPGSDAPEEPSEPENGMSEKPRLVPDDEEAFSPERALMKANQVQNVGDAVIYPANEGAKNKKKEYSVLVYMVGSDLEASYGYATRDMQEMEESGIDFDINNLVIYAGGSRMWKSDIPSNQNNVLDMSREGEDRVVAATKHTSDMGAPETLAAFLEYAVEYYPAEHYALIFWDHGGGSIYGYGNDTLYSGDSLLLSEMDTVLAASPFGENGSAHLDWVGFDACLMSTAENAVVWSKYADYRLEQICRLPDRL